MQRQHFISNAVYSGLIALLSFSSLFHTSNVLAASQQDDLFESIKQIELQTLVDAVLVRNVELKAGTARWNAAKARISQSMSYKDPMVSYRIAPRTYGNSTIDAGYVVTLSQQLPWPGKLSLHGTIAQHTADAFQSEIENSRFKLVQFTKQTFADWYYVFAEIQINAINKNLLKEFRSIAEIKYAAGSTSRQDTLRAEMELATLEHRDLELKRQRQAIQTQLNTLLHRLPNSYIPPPVTLSFTHKLPSIEQLRATALVAQPELKSMGAQLQSRKSSVELAQKEFFPDFKLTAIYNTLWNQDQKHFNLGISVNIPIRGKRIAAKDEAQANVIQFNHLLAGKRIEILAELQRAYDHVEESRHVITLYNSRLIPLADEMLSAAKADYESGKGDFLALISSEKNFMQMKLNAAKALVDFHQQLSRLERWVGNLETPHSQNTRSS